MKPFWKSNIDESSFLPAVLAVEQTPPNLPSRLVAYAIIILFLCLLIWSLLGKLDVIAVAHGKVIPAGHSKTIQSPEAGIVTEILVTEGEQVQRGQLLMRLDDTAIRAELRRNRNECWVMQALLERNSVLLEHLDGSDKELPVVQFSASIPADIRQRHEEQLHTQLKNFLSNLKAKQAGKQEHQYSLQALRVELQELEQQIPFMRRQLDSVSKLKQQELASEHEYLQQEQVWNKHTHRQEALKRKIQALEASVERTTTEIMAFQQSFRNQLLSEKEKVVRKQVELEQQRVKLQSGLDRLSIRAPVDGRVERLAMNTPGAVVSHAQALMSIVPDDAPLLIEAYVQNKDIGFITEGQQATVKVDAFPFMRFGTVAGEVSSISSDAFNAQEQGWLFKAKIDMPAPYLDTSEQQYRLSPGMSAQVEIRTGERKIIDYFLSPFQVKISESLGER